MSTEEKEGWVYCISNENVRSAKSPNNLLKIGMTDRTPQERLAEANRSDTWRPPVNYKIEFAKKVKNAIKKEKTLHKLLEQYNERVNHGREFFDISVEKARLYFDLMDGTYWESMTESIPEIKGGKRKKKSDKEEPPPVVEREENIVVLEPPKTKSKKYIKPYQIKLENLSEKESLKLLKLAQEKEALEIKVSDTYYLYDDIIKGTIKKLLLPDMVFRPILKSSDDADRIISSSNLQVAIDKLKSSAPSSFIYVEEVTSNISEESEIKKALFEKFLNANVNDLTLDESKILISNAINMESLTVRTPKKFYRFIDLENIKPNIIKNTKYEAWIVPAPNGIANIDLDSSIFINKSNYSSILKIFKNTSEKHVLVLSELSKV